MNDELKKENRGGKRPGCGRPKAPYELTTVAFRVRAHFRDEIIDYVKTKIQQLHTQDNKRYAK